MIKIINTTKRNEGKNFRNFTFVMAAFSLLAIFTGCKKTEDEIVNVITNPVITVASPTDGESKISGSKMTFAFAANTDNGIKRVVIKYKPSGGAEVTRLDTALGTQPNSFSFSREYTVGAIGTETYTIMVTDKKDNVQTKSVNVKSSTGFADETFGKFYHILGSSPGAFDLAKSEQRLNADADADKDMMNTDASGTFTGGWEAKNSTMFVKSLTFNYSNGTTIEAEQAYAAGTPTAKVTTPLIGDIYIAKLRNTNTLVVIKVVSSEPLNEECGCSNKGKLTFNLKKSL
jgi:hypothetical protein